MPEEKTPPVGGSEQPSSAESVVVSQCHPKSRPLFFEAWDPSEACLFKLFPGTNVQGPLEVCVRNQKMTERARRGATV